METVKTKIVKSGNYVEFFKYEKPVARGFSRSKRENPRELSEEEKIKNRKSSLRRARDKIRRLIYGNKSLNRTFELTFKENITDLRKANKEFRNFIKRLKYYYGDDLKYISVVEFQERGAIHYHLVVDRFIPVNKSRSRKDEKSLREIWNNGIVFIQSIKNRNEQVDYITKYMSKLKASDKRLWGEKSYFTSRNLKRPLELINPTLSMIKRLLGVAVNSFEELKILMNKNFIEKSRFNSDYFGNIDYFSFNLEPI